MAGLTVGSRAIGGGRPAFVIAEIGVNHDGSVARALELVEHAHAGGADAVKLQIFRAESLIHGQGILAGYQKERCAEGSAAEMLRRYELRSDEIRRVVQAIRARGLAPLATPFSPGDVALIAELDLPAVKIASPDLVNRPLLKRVAELGRPLLVSTGAADMDEVGMAVQWLREWGAEFGLLHCVSSYPAPLDQANLCWIRELSVFGAPVGYSDHTTEQMAGALAVAGGASIIEKHLTYDRRAAGPDHAASADPRQFAGYVQAIRLTERMRGKPGKRVLPVEQDVRQVSRQSLVLARDVDGGQVLGEGDLTTQRPGTGISAAEVQRVIGRVIKQAAAAGSMLRWEMLD